MALCRALYLCLFFVAVAAEEQEPPGTTRFIRAAKIGNTADVRKIIAEETPDVEETDGYGMTALMYASENGHTGTVLALLEDGKADVATETTYGGMTALMLAAYSGQAKVVKVLLEAGKCDVNAVDHKYKRSPLVQASKHGHYDTVKVLLEVGKAEVNQKTDDGKTAFRFASRGGHKEVMELLREHGAHGLMPGEEMPEIPPEPLLDRILNSVLKWFGISVHSGPSRDELITAAMMKGRKGPRAAGTFNNFVNKFNAQNGKPKPEPEDPQKQQFLMKEDL